MVEDMTWPPVPDLWAADRIREVLVVDVCAACCWWLVFCFGLDHELGMGEDIEVPVSMFACFCVAQNCI